MTTTRLLRKGIPLLALGACLSLGISNQSHATEGGGGAYANGIEGFGAGMLPPPGTYFLNYVNVYTARDFNNADGDSAVPGFKLDVAANVFRLVHMTKHQLLGGTWGMQLILPVMYMDVSTPGGSQSKTGLGDIVVDPILLAYHTKNFHYALGLDIIVPTGAYDQNDLANLGRNYWTFEPVVAATYLNEAGCEASVKLMYDFNTENSDTDYKSGQEFHLDYTLAKRFGAFTLGAGGYYYKQVTNDKSNGVTVADSKGQVLALGPQFKYDYKNMSFSVKYQHEMLVENKPEGEKFWFNLLYAF